MLRVSCSAPGASTSQALATETPQNALPLSASSRTAFVFAAAASAPLLQRPRALENATHEARGGIGVISGAEPAGSSAKTHARRARFPARGLGCDCRHATGKTM